MKFTFEQKLTAVKLHKEKGTYKYPKGYEAKSKKQVYRFYVQFWEAQYDRNGEEGHTALADTAQQMFKTCGFHHQTNSFAAAGCLFTMISATTPPFMRMTRLAILAISSLCVTMSMVVPALITSSSTVRTSMLVS